MSAATHWCPARVLDQAHCSVAARSTAAASSDLFSECAKAVTCPHAVSIYPSRRDDSRRFLNDTNELRRLEIGNRLAIRHGDLNRWPERLNFPVLREGLCQECSFSFKSGVHAIESCGTATLLALWTQFALVCGWREAESAE